MGEIKSYKDLVVWKKAMELVFAVYDLTKLYPKEEQFALVPHTRKTVISIPSNIAEGSRRSTRKDFRSFILNAFGSGAELETQLEIGFNLYGKGIENKFNKCFGLLEEVMRMLNRLEETLDK